MEATQQKQQLGITDKLITAVASIKRLDSKQTKLFSKGSLAYINV